MAAKRRSKPATVAGSATAGRRRLPRGLGAADGALAAWGRWFLLALGVWLILAVLYPEPMFKGQVFGSADAGNAEAFSQVGDAELGGGDYPLWNPYLFGGMPSFGSLAYVRFLYPPSTLFNFLQQKLGFAPLTWMLGHLMLGGLGMVWLLSRWRLPAGALLLGAAAFLLFPKIVAWGVHGHGTQLGAAMYLPWLVGWTLRVLEGTGPRAVGMVGLLLGMQLLRGHPQISYYTLLLVGWLGLWNGFSPLDAALSRVATAVRWRRLGLVVLGLGLGFLIAAALLVPVHDYASISIRGQDTAGGGGVGLDYATGWSLAPSETGTFLLPTAAGFGMATYLGHMPFNDYPNYFGVLMLLLAAAAASRETRSLMLALVSVVVVAVCVAFGRHGFGLYEVMYDVLPFFNKFRIPSMILVLPAFALAVLAARGAARWTGGADPGGRPVILPALLAGIGLLMLLAGAAQLAQGSYRQALTDLAVAAGRQPAPALLDAAWQLHRSSLIRIGLILLTAGVAGWAAVKNPVFRSRGLVWVLVALLGLDLLGADRLIVHPDGGLLQLARTASGQARLVKAGPLLHEYQTTPESAPGDGARRIGDLVGHDRIWPLGRLGSRNQWMADRIRSLGGYHAAKLASYEAVRSRLYGEQLAGRLASWLSARAVVFERPLEASEIASLAALGVDLEPTAVPAGALWLHRNRAVLPRARLLTAWEPGPPSGSGQAPQVLSDFLDGVQAGRIDVTRTVRLSETPDPLPVAALEPLPVPVFEVDGMDEVVVRTAAPGPAILLLADVMAPGWTVEVDGEPAALMTADHILRAVALPGGDHTVRFLYRDPAVRAGLTLTTIGVILTLGLLLAPILMNRRRAAVTAVARERASDD